MERTSEQAKALSQAAARAAADCARTTDTYGRPWPTTAPPPPPTSRRE